jgi:hypothetical protein
MSTPPTPQPEQNPPPTPPRSRSSLAKLAIAFAVTIAITFGLCSAALMRSTNAVSGPILPAAVIIEGICVVGLIVVAILAAKTISGSARHMPDPSRIAPRNTHVTPKSKTKVSVS